LKLKCDELLSSCAFNVNLRRYIVGTRTTHRIVNNQWAALYGALAQNLGRLPLVGRCRLNPG